MRHSAGRPYRLRIQVFEVESHTVILARKTDNALNFGGGAGPRGGVGQNNSVNYIFTGILATKMEPVHVDAATGQPSASKARKRKRGTSRATEEEQAVLQEETTVDEAPKKKVYSMLLGNSVLHLEYFTALIHLYPFITYA